MDQKKIKQAFADNVRAYGDNFVLIQKHLGTPEAEKYIKKENELNEENVALRRKLGIYIEQPNPRRTKKYRFRSYLDIYSVARERGKGDEYIKTKEDGGAILPISVD